MKLASSQVICLICNGKRTRYNLSQVSKHTAVFSLTTNQSRFNISLFSTDVVLGHRENIFQITVTIEIKIVKIIHANTERRKEIE